MTVHPCLCTFLAPKVPLSSWLGSTPLNQLTEVQAAVYESLAREKAERRGETLPTMLTPLSGLLTTALLGATAYAVTHTEKPWQTWGATLLFILWWSPHFASALLKTSANRLKEQAEAFKQRREAAAAEANEHTENA